MRVQENVLYPAIQTQRWVADKRSRQGTYHGFGLPRKQSLLASASLDFANPSQAGFNDENGVLILEDEFECSIPLHPGSIFGDTWAPWPMRGPAAPSGSPNNFGRLEDVFI